MRSLIGKDGYFFEQPCSRPWLCLTCLSHTANITLQGPAQNGKIVNLLKALWVGFFLAIFLNQLHGSQAWTLCVTVLFYINRLGTPTRKCLYLLPHCIFYADYYVSSSAGLSRVWNWDHLWGMYNSSISKGDDEKTFNNDYSMPTPCAGDEFQGLLPSKEKMCGDRLEKSMCFSSLPPPILN